MKQTALLIATLFTLKLSSQTPCNDIAGNWHFEVGNTYIEFLVNDSTLTDSNSSVRILKEMLTQIASNVEVNGNTLIAEVKNFGFSDKNCGFASLTTPYLMSSQVSFNVSVSFKTGRYKVKCNNFNTLMTVYGTTVSSNWNTEIYKKNGCVKSSLSLSNFEKADCQLKQMTAVKKAANSDW